MVPVDFKVVWGVSWQIVFPVRLSFKVFLCRHVRNEQIFVSPERVDSRRCGVDFADELNCRRIFDILGIFVSVDVE